MRRATKRAEQLANSGASWAAKFRAFMQKETSFWDITFCLLCRYDAMCGPGHKEGIQLQAVVRRCSEEMREEALRKSQAEGPPCFSKEDVDVEDPEHEHKLMAAEAAKAADAAVAAAPEDQVLSKQVLWQKAFIAEMANQSNLKLPPQAEVEDSESQTSEDQMEVLQRLLETVTPCASTYPVTVTQATDRQRVEGKADHWTPLKGSQLVVKPANEEDHKSH
eukprot:g2227.t1